MDRRADALRRARRRAHAAVEFVLAHGSGARGEFDQVGWSAARTDAEGRFRIPGQCAREYALAVYDERRLERAAAGPFGAGRDDLRIVFPRGELAPLRGRIVSRAMAPLAGVLVLVEGETDGGVWKQGGDALTGDDGRFEFPEVGNAPVSLLLRGKEVVPAWHFLSGRPEGEIEIVLPLRCNAKVELADPERAGAAWILDEVGTRLDLYQIGATGVTYGHEIGLVDGRSATFGVSEEARTLVLLKDGSCRERLPLRLSTERLNLLAF